ncbi:hypothetical protein ACTXT7_015457 [Hymenolepis weldensis]
MLNTGICYQICDKNVLLSFANARVFAITCPVLSHWSICEITTGNSGLLRYDRSGDTVMDSLETTKIALFVRNIMEQMNLSKPDKDLDNYVKNIVEFHYEPPVRELFATLYAQNQDVSENRMT